jgi:hypothetical protein
MTACVLFYSLQFQNLAAILFQYFYTSTAAQEEEPSNGGLMGLHPKQHDIDTLIASDHC